MNSIMVVRFFEKTIASMLHYDNISYHSYEPLVRNDDKNRVIYIRVPVVQTISGRLLGFKWHEGDGLELNML